jgi:hypothetical protein
MIKNIKQPDSDIIPAQQVIVQNKRILSELTNISARLDAMKSANASREKENPADAADRRMQEWRSRLTSIRNLKRAIAVLAVLLLALSAAFYYDHNLTDDAWARRAYDAAEKLNDPKPGIQYIRVRLLFDEGKKKSAQALTLDLEAQVDALKDEEAKQ